MDIKYPKGEKKMNEKSEISELEKIHKKTRLAGIAAGYIALIGVMILALVGLFAFATSIMMNDSHLQNPAMPYNEYPQNASYVWTHSEIMHSLFAIIPFATVGIIAIVGGFIVLVLLPDKKDFHKLGCENGKLISLTYPSLKYCPECGVKLSELEPKKRNN
jgi:quinol-cytochrome oxidoreductase complex cytochrome b subunit